MSCILYENKNVHVFIFALPFRETHASLLWMSFEPFEGSNLMELPNYVEFFFWRLNPPMLQSHIILEMMQLCSINKTRTWNGDAFRLLQYFRATGEKEAKQAQLAMGHEPRTSRSIVLCSTTSAHPRIVLWDLKSAQSLPMTSPRGPFITSLHRMS